MRREICWDCGFKAPRSKRRPPPPGSCQSCPTYSSAMLALNGEQVCRDCYAYGRRCLSPSEAGAVRVGSLWEDIGRRVVLGDIWSQGPGNRLRWAPARLLLVVAVWGEGVVCLSGWLERGRFIVQPSKAVTVIRKDRMKPAAIGNRRKGYQRIVDQWTGWGFGVEWMGREDVRRILESMERPACGRGER